MKNVFIIGDKSFIKSKNALKRLKEQVKNEEDVDSTKYLIKGYSLTINKEKNKQEEFDYFVKILTLEEKQKLDNKQELKNRLKNMKEKRTTSMTEKINSIKRSVPKNIFNKYMNLIKKYQFDLPSPDEILKNPEKFKQQISTMAGTMSKVSNNGDANSAIKGYFKSLADLLDIEPMTINVKPEKNLNLISHDSDTEDEDVPDLVSKIN